MSSTNRTTVEEFIATNYQRHLGSAERGRLTHSYDPEDILQQVYLDLWEAFGDRPQAEYYLWGAFRRKVHNTWVNFLVAENRDKRGGGADVLLGDELISGIHDHVQTPYYVAIMNESLEILQDMLDSIGGVQGQALRMKALEGASYQDIEQACDLKPKSASAYIYNARELLRARLVSQNSGFLNLYRAAYGSFGEAISEPGSQDHVVAVDVRNSACDLSGVFAGRS